MQVKLNYYSRYNRIKCQQKKSIPSLYSLLSTETLNKLAHDASVSLQMITFYNRQNNFAMAQEQNYQSEYLQASKNKFNHSLYHSLDQKAHSVSPSIKNSRDQKMSSSLVKGQRISKKKYLENLVKEVRQKSLERVKNSENVLKQDRKKKKRQKNKISKAILDQLNSQQTVKQQELKHQSLEINEISVTKIQNRLIKSLLTQQKNSKKPSIEQRSGQQKRDELQKRDGNFNKEYVQSVQDDNQQNSKHSIVIERLNLMKGNIVQQKPNKDEKQSSKEDNPSEKDKKESEIKSFSKQSTKKYKPTKNLIQLELTHSQSQILKPQQRSLDGPERPQKEQQNEHGNQSDTNQLDAMNFPILKNESPGDFLDQEQDVQKALSILSKEEQIQDQIKDVIGEHIEQITNSYPMSKSYKLINSQSPVQFLSQLNHNKNLQQAPYQHPLQIYSSTQKTNQQTQNHVSRQEPKTDSVKKTSFKKFIMNKELNPRLVTSTILNQKNSLNHHPLIRDFPKDHYHVKHKQNQEPNQIDQTPEKRQKKNFKKMMMNKKGTAKELMPCEKEEKIIPLKKLENQKLLHGFFNDN